MEKRLVLFIMASVMIFTGYGLLRMRLMPPPAQEVAQKDGAKKPDGKADKESKKSAPGKALEEDLADAKQKSTPDETDAKQTPAKGDKKDSATSEISAEPAARPEPVIDQKWMTLGSFAAGSPYRLLITFTNKGAAVEKVELVERRANGKLRYRDLDRDDGYLGLQCRETDAGCEVISVGPGTPAMLAKPADGTLGFGIMSGDLIIALQGQPVRGIAEYEARMLDTHPGQAIRLGVRRKSDGIERTIEFAATLSYRPLALIQPEAAAGTRAISSFLLGLDQVDKRQVKLGQDELPDLVSLRHDAWKIEDGAADEVVFSHRVTLDAVEGADADQLEIVKRYKLVAMDPKAIDEHADPAYHLQMRLEIKNQGKQAHEVAYFLDGPNGLPTEGWWYANKIHPSWGSAGARDVIWQVHGHSLSLRSASQIYKEYQKDPDQPLEMILSDTPVAADRSLDYLGVDTQYFSAVLMEGPIAKPTPFVCRQAYAMPVGPVPKLSGREVFLLNTSFRVASEPAKIAPGESVATDYHIFLGPKSTELLESYGISDIVVYGWFWWIAKPLSYLLHFFYFVVRNYGLAIILLTVLVRGAMFPVGRKAARNAQVMQELAPQLKALKEKYKNDMEKQAQAQRELWKKHNFNPLGGCWLMFLQLPIFIGLYRCLSVDIELRQAALIPGVRWCSNLAGPDMFWNWQSLGFEFLTGRNGWLGPYLNILPIFTVVLFIVQQKMFTPPATDDQSRMQQSMMKYMMVFMGVMFFKVAAGLCLYFIASSLWGIAERKLLPKSDINKEEEPAREPTKNAGAAGRATGGKPVRGETKEKKVSILDRIEQWQRKAEQKVNQPRSDRSRPDERPRGKKRRR